VLLTEIEARVLGSLIEKDMTTPEHYPLSLNALVNACNQKSSRDPVVNFDEDIVRDAVETLRDKKLAIVVTGGDNRVPKYRHRISETLNLGNRELAVLGVLLLRGPQTTGELKQRTERLHAFDDPEAVESCLTRLSQWQPDPLTVKLIRQVGERESRWAHLLCGEVPVVPATASADAEPPRGPGVVERIAKLEEKVADLERQFAEFRKQFE
jgi:uncharacterized protein YceH (UPF0502 family)